MNLNTLIWTCIRFDGLDGLDFAKSQCDNGVINDKDFAIIELFYCGLLSTPTVKMIKDYLWDRIKVVHSNKMPMVIYSQVSRMRAALQGLPTFDVDYSDHIEAARCQRFATYRLAHNGKTLIARGDMNKYINFCISYKDLL